MSFFFKTFACIVISTEKKYKDIASLQNTVDVMDTPEQIVQSRVRQRKLYWIAWHQHLDVCKDVNTLDTCCFLFFAVILLTVSPLEIEKWTWMKEKQGKVRNFKHIYLQNITLHARGYGYIYCSEDLDFRLFPLLT